MAKSGEFYTFDEVVRQLKIDENKLKRLVSEGEISAFREGDVMKFKKSEIDKIAKKGAGSETSETVLSEITLEEEAPAFEESGETLTDDLVFEGAEEKTGGGQKTQEISSQDTFIEAGKGSDVGMTTEPIDLSADLTQEAEEEAEEAPAAAQKKATLARTGVAARRSEAAAPAGSPGLTFALGFAALLAFLAIYLAVAVSNNEAGSGPLGSGISRKLSDIIYDNFGMNDEVDKAIRDKGWNPAAVAQPAGGGGAGG